ncbi:hypothetical protein [Nocardioides sp. SYSU D00038]|uniref:hypothetical protein n=1 Tax=Nocardioides sp. SYSU D00038 TaxID=2812554 RepID=UPI0019673BAF|nr:hypothetical protein [Nocardioides sp. SYSU D00038]
MQYVEVRSDPDGYWYDASRYVEALLGIAEQLPSGARTWASDPQHYDLSSPRCVKDLSLVGLDVQPEFVLRLGPNEWKHQQGLEVRYIGVVSFDFEIRQPVNSPPPSVQLDEVLPHELGCQHDVAFHGGRLSVVAKDLTAIWLDASNDRPYRA